MYMHILPCRHGECSAESPLQASTGYHQGTQEWIHVSQQWSINLGTVEPLYSGHPWGTTFWPLYRGGLY